MSEKWLFLLRPVVLDFCNFGSGFNLTPPLIESEEKNWDNWFGLAWSGWINRDSSHEALIIYLSLTPIHTHTFQPHTFQPHTNTHTHTHTCQPHINTHTRTHANHTQTHTNAHANHTQTHANNYGLLLFTTFCGCRLQVSLFISQLQHLAMTVLGWETAWDLLLRLAWVLILILLRGERSVTNKPPTDGSIVQVSVSGRALKAVQPISAGQKSWQS